MEGSSRIVSSHMIEGRRRFHLLAVGKCRVRLRQEPYRNMGCNECEKAAIVEKMLCVCVIGS